MNADQIMYKHDVESDGLSLFFPKGEQHEHINKPLDAQNHSNLIVDPNAGRVEVVRIKKLLFKLSGKTFRGASR